MHAYPRSDTRCSHTPTCPSSLTHTPLHLIHLPPDVTRSPVPRLARPCRRPRQAVCPPPPRVHSGRPTSWQSDRPEGTTTHHRSAWLLAPVPTCQHPIIPVCLCSPRISPSPRCPSCRSSEERARTMLLAPSCSLPISRVYVFVCACVQILAHKHTDIHA